MIRLHDTVIVLDKKEHVCVHQYTAGFNNINLLFVMDVNISLLMSTTSFSINKALEKWDDKPKLDFIDHYYTDKGYIQSLALSVVEHQ
jgi:protoheme ferro-lyase